MLPSQAPRSGFDPLLLLFESLAGQAGQGGQPPFGGPGPSTVRVKHEEQGPQDHQSKLNYQGPVQGALPGGNDLLQPLGGMSLAQLGSLATLLNVGEAGPNCVPLGPGSGGGVGVQPAEPPQQAQALQQPPHHDLSSSLTAVLAQLKAAAKAQEQQEQWRPLAGPIGGVHLWQQQSLGLQPAPPVGPLLPPAWPPQQAPAQQPHPGQLALSQLQAGGAGPTLPPPRPLTYESQQAQQARGPSADAVLQDLLLRGLRPPAHSSSAAGVPMHGAQLYPGDPLLGGGPGGGAFGGPAHLSAAAGRTGLGLVPLGQQQQQQQQQQIQMQQHHQMLQQQQQQPQQQQMHPQQPHQEWQRQQLGSEEGEETEEEDEALGAGSDRGRGAESVGGGGSGGREEEDSRAEARRKNREAQQRFRERQRAAVKDAEEQYASMEEEALRVREENAVLASRNRILAATLSVRDSLLAALVGPPAGAAGPTPAQLPLLRERLQQLLKQGQSAQQGQQQAQQAQQGGQQVQQQQQQQAEQRSFEERPVSPAAAQAGASRQAEEALLGAEPGALCDAAAQFGPLPQASGAAATGNAAACEGSHGTAQPGTAHRAGSQQGGGGGSQLGLREGLAAGPEIELRVQSREGQEVPSQASVLPPPEVAELRLGGDTGEIPDIADLEAASVEFKVPISPPPDLAERVQRMSYEDFVDSHRQWQIDMTFAWQQAQAEGLSQQSLAELEQVMGSFLHTWRAVLEWRPGYAKLHMARAYLPPQEHQRVEEVAGVIQLSDCQLRRLAATWRRFQCKWRELEAERDLWCSMLRALPSMHVAGGGAGDAPQQPRGCRRRAAGLGCAQSSFSSGGAAGGAEMESDAPGESPMEGLEVAGGAEGEGVDMAGAAAGEAGPGLDGENEEQAAKGVTVGLVKHESGLEEAGQQGRGAGYGSGPGMFALSEAAMTVAKAASRLDHIADQEFQLYNDLAGGWIMCLGLQNTARANLACYPYIVDWVGIAHELLRRGIQEGRLPRDALSMEDAPAEELPPS